MKLAPADVALLVELSGLRFLSDDLAPLADALERHLAFVAPLLDAEFEDGDASFTHVPGDAPGAPRD
jgi:hypothetical protein